ncbi:hypothetical protein ACFSHT_08995 [Paraburkholderia silviterrae]|uniref:Uncharacterized protein n=1 Tax=Paraburkholderia silviterrae TaxID=2528715 RepID=A0A4R5MDM2_9BURK|nr:hypothetical protein [Paraburkholderia silviterrae]TDG25129.1 hypothetical protein EYW47_04505 [Paraburkholderia silviterrae]
MQVPANVLYACHLPPGTPNPRPVGSVEELLPGELMVVDSPMLFAHRRPPNERDLFIAECLASAPELSLTALECWGA